MLALIRKDLRVNLVPIIGAAVVVIGVFAAAVAMYIGERSVPFRALGSIPCGMGILLTSIMGAVFGGATFAQERRDRSADFLAMMPVSRGRIVVSKIIASGLPLLIMGILFGAPLITMEWGTWVLWREDSRELIREYGIPLGVFLAMYGVAWLLSAFLSSPAISASVSIGVAGGIMRTLEVVGRGAGSENHGVRETLLPATVGVVSFIMGCGYYMRRVEP